MPEMEEMAPKHSRIARIPVVPAKIKRASSISSALGAFFRERSLQIIELGRVRKNAQNASWRFPGTSGVFFPRILPTNTYIYIPVLEYHRIPYSERVREDAEYIPLIRAFLRSNTPKGILQSSISEERSGIRGKIQNRRSLLLFEQRAIRTRESAFIPSSRENNNNNRSVSLWWCFLRLENPLVIRLISRRDQ